MSVVTGALGSIGPKLLQLLQDEYKLQKGVKKQVRWLSDELESVYAFLTKVGEVPWDRLDEQVKVWAREVREASYDMEDVLDTFLVRVEDSGQPADPSRLKRAIKKMGKVFSKSKARRGIAGAIEDIKKHLQEVAERRQKYKLDDIISKTVPTTSTIDPRLAAMYKEVSQLIGIDKSRDELVSMLMPFEPDDDASHKKIVKKVSIVGVGGLGKTTLAKAVYDKFKSEYHCGAFVSVGREHDLVKVFKDILFDLDKFKYKNIHSDERGASLIIRELRDFLENKRYFVVVDDVWDVKTWETINLALIENNCGSRVIITTRKLDVAKDAGEVYKLQPLSYDNSKKLLYTRIFGLDGKHHDNQPDDVSDKILKKCDGIPLAIITMTSLLAAKPKDEWSEVYSSIGFGQTKDIRDVEDTMLILSFSYYDMPPHLRTCLMYLCTYPEDYLIAKDYLIWKWIAEGFVHGKQGTCLFELGERYFNDLINRSMIQAVEDVMDDRVSGCRIHDMILDLMRTFSFEENFISLDVNVEGTSSLSNVRRLAHQSRTPKHNNSEAKVFEMPKVRSYIATRCDTDNWAQFSSFKLLRVLDIECNSKDVCHLEHLGNLFHLRFLGIRGFISIDELPKQIGDLKLLQTLDVSGLWLEKRPASIVRLTQLVCLRARHLPDGIGKLTSLEDLTISNLPDDKPDKFEKELGSLRELRVLKVSVGSMDESMERDFLESLRNLQKMQHIEVSGDGSCMDIAALWEASGFLLPRPLRYLRLPIRFSKLPSCINPSRLPNLSHLILAVKNMDEQDLKLLARLPELCFLDLVTESTVTASDINAGEGCFQKLRYFKANQAAVQFVQPNQDSRVSLHIWMNGGGAMPFNSSRERNCTNVVPSAVMPNLEVLEFDVRLRALKDNNIDCGNFGFKYLPSLRQVSVCVFSYDVSYEEKRATFAALRNSCKIHPNHPRLYISRMPPEKKASQGIEDDDDSC